MKQRRADKLVEFKEHSKLKLIETRANLLRQAIEQMQYSDQIRNLINAVKDKAIDQGNPSGLGQWVAWAVEQADAIDPRAQSLEDTGTWISQFKLQFKASL
jgi:hypothetical protein